MKTIVLCNEYSQKMFPFDFHWQKTCLPIVNKPNILRIIEQLIKNNCKEKDIYVVVGYRKDQVKSILKNYTALNYIDVDPSNNLKTAYESMVAILDTEVLIYNAGSVITDNDFEIFLSSGHRNKAFFTKKVDASTNHICAKVTNNLVECFFGHPREHYVTHLVTGLYLLESETFTNALKSDIGFDKNNSGAMPPQEFFLENGLNQSLLNKRIHIVENTDEVFQLTFPWDLLNANEFYVSQLCQNLKKDEIGTNSSIDPSVRKNGYVKIGSNTTIGKNVVINGNVVIGNNVLIDNGVILEGDTYIGDHTYIKDYAKVGEKTIIGLENKIGHNAEIKGLTMRGVSAIHYSEIFGVVGNYVDIAAACVTGILRFNDTEQPQRIAGKMYTGKNTNALFLGDFTRTGINNIFLPGCKVGSNCALSPGLIVAKDIEHKKIVFQKQELTTKEWGPEKYGW